MTEGIEPYYLLGETYLIPGPSLSQTELYLNHLLVTPSNSNPQVTLKLQMYTASGLAIACPGETCPGTFEVDQASGNVTLAFPASGKVGSFDAELYGEDATGASAAVKRWRYGVIDPANGPDGKGCGLGKLVVDTTGRYPTFSCDCSEAGMEGANCDSATAMSSVEAADSNGSSIMVALIIMLLILCAVSAVAWHNRGRPDTQMAINAIAQRDAVLERLQSLSSAHGGSGTTAAETAVTETSFDEEAIMLDTMHAQATPSFKNSMYRPHGVPVSLGGGGEGESSDDEVNADNLLLAEGEDMYSAEGEDLYSGTQSFKGGGLLSVMGRRNSHSIADTEPISATIQLPIGITFGGNAKMGFYITNCKPGLNAARSGVLKAGQRIISANGNTLEGLEKPAVVQ
jgi:hypothetical protein